MSGLEINCVFFDALAGQAILLFAGADSGGERAAAMYSLIGSSKLNGIDPEAYLRHVLVLQIANSANGEH